jgi:hypothetical protein
VHNEHDARAIVRHLTEENLFVTRDSYVHEAVPSQTEPA